MHSCARSGTRGSPAHAGMDPTPSSARPRRCRLPRTRGDGPGSEPLRYRWKVAPPHTRGWTPAAGAPPILRRGSPAHAGMDRRQRARDAGFQRLPRTRGDGPIAGFPGGLTSRAPPHTRGWTRAALGAGARQDGSPAHAGMDPLYVVDNRSPFGLPRTRGDGPLAAAHGYFGEVEQGFRGSGTQIPAKWNARRSVATLLGQFPPMVVATDLRDPTRDVVVESKDEVACGACGRRLRRPRCCGTRAFCNASVDAECIARVFHSTGRIHRPLEPGGSVAGVADVLVLGARCGVVVVARVFMSSPSGGWPARRACVASSAPSGRCGARRGAGGRRSRRPGWGRR